MIIRFNDAKTGALIALVPITTDQHGYLYADHPTLSQECEYALYGYQEGRISTDTIDDDDDVPYLVWTIEDWHLTDDGAYAIEFNDMSITDPYTSECGRFDVDPSYYGLTEQQAQTLKEANHG